VFVLCIRVGFGQEPSEILANGDCLSVGSLNCLYIEAKSIRRASLDCNEKFVQIYEHLTVLALDYFLITYDELPCNEKNTPLDWKNMQEGFLLMEVRLYA